MLSLAWKSPRDTHSQDLLLFVRKLYGREAGKGGGCVLISSYKCDTLNMSRAARLHCNLIVGCHVAFKTPGIPARRLRWNALLIRVQSSSHLAAPFSWNVDVADPKEVPVRSCELNGKPTGRYRLATDRGILSSSIFHVSRIIRTLVRELRPSEKRTLYLLN